MAYETLKCRIRDNQIIEPEIDEKIKELDGQFTGQEECCPPFPWRLAYDGVKELGSLLEKIKRFDLLEGFAILQNRVISSLSPNGDICEIIEEPFVKLFTFADEIIELIDLQEKRSRKVINSWCDLGTAYDCSMVLQYTLLLLDKKKITLRYSPLSKGKFGKG